MAVTILSAAASTKDPLSNELKVSMRDQIALLDTDDTQFTTMLMDSRLQKEKANSFKEEWLEDQYVPRLSTLGASAASGDTAITTATNEGFYFRAGDIVRNAVTGASMLVTVGNTAPDPPVAPVPVTPVIVMPCTLASVVAPVETIVRSPDSAR